MSSPWKVPTSAVLVGTLAKSTDSLAAQPEPVDGHATVRASHTVEREPDLMVINLSSVSRGETADKAHEKAFDISFAVAEALKDIVGVTLLGGGVRSNPVYTEREEGKIRKILAYDAHWSIEVRAKTAAGASEAIDNATKTNSGVMVTQLRFTLEDDSEAYNEALNVAMGEARRQAQTIATAGGVGLGRLLSVDTQRRNSYPRSFHSEDSSAAQATLRTIPGLARVTATVDVTFELVDVRSGSLRSSRA